MSEYDNIVGALVILKRARIECIDHHGAWLKLYHAANYLETTYFDALLSDPGEL